MADSKFTAGPSVSELPKRKGGAGRTFDQDSANALLALTTAKEGATATDNKAYAEKKEANSAVAGARRLLDRVKPEGTIAKTKVYEDADGKYRWSLFLTKEKAPDAK